MKRKSIEYLLAPNLLLKKKKKKNEEEIIIIFERRSLNKAIRQHSMEFYAASVFIQKKKNICGVSYLILVDVVVVLNL